MTRAFFKGLTIRAVICVVLTFVFLLSCFWYADNVSRAEKQEEYQEKYGSLLMAAEYRMLHTDVLENHEAVKAVYSAYDETGRLLGYIVDVQTRTAAGFMHTQMSISDNGENLLNIRVVDEGENGQYFTEDQMEILREQLKGARIPVALRRDLPSDVPYQVDYDPLLGLHDGVYYARAEKASSDGYTDYCEMEVRGGRIVRVEWDAENEQSHTMRSSDSISGEYKVSGNIWAEQAYRLCNHLVLVQDTVKLAMKSDGKTEIIEGVTVDISTFVMLANQCIEYSRSSFTKEKYLSDTGDGSEGEHEEQPEPTPVPGDTGETAETAAPLPTKAPTEIEVIGGEDGVVSGENDNVLSDSVDGIPMSEIRSFIDGLEGDATNSAALLTTVNEAYKFMREYLNWVG
ncbi:MAG: hypothetical protein J5379_07685 [Clostridiales bacterium]|nr:hypothetical protein [Clostridiales bacterium]